MDDLRASFDEERYPNRYVLEVPDRQGRQVYKTIEKFIAEQGIDARITYRTNSDNGTLSWDIGIATADTASYAAITRHLDQEMHGWVMDHINETHGAGHPLNKYLTQLKGSVSGDELIKIAAEFSGQIEVSRKAAIDAAYRDFETVRTQWADQPDDPHLLLE